MGYRQVDIWGAIRGPDPVTSHRIMTNEGSMSGLAGKTLWHKRTEQFFHALSGAAADEQKRGVAGVEKRESIL